MNKMAHEQIKEQIDENIRFWDDTKMNTFRVNGKKVKTNLFGIYKLWNGNDYPKNKRVVHVPFGKYDVDIFDQLIAEGYTSIRFVETSTAVRGLHEVYAFCAGRR